MQSLGLLSGQVKVDMATHSPLSHADVVHASMVQFWKLSIVPLHCPFGEQWSFTSTMRKWAWCGVVWCGVVWCGVVWCGVVWCGVVWCGVIVLYSVVGEVRVSGRIAYQYKGYYHYTEWRCGWWWCCIQMHPRRSESRMHSHLGMPSYWEAFGHILFPSSKKRRSPSNKKW